MTVQKRMKKKRLLLKWRGDIYVKDSTRKRIELYTITVWLTTHIQGTKIKVKINNTYCRPVRNYQVSLTRN